MANETVPTYFTIPDLIDYCPFPLKHNPHHKEVEPASLAWFDGYKVHVGKKREEFYKAKFCTLGSMSYPEADAVRLRNCDDFILWLFAFDDLTDDGGYRHDIPGTKAIAESMMTSLRRPHEKSPLAVAETLRDFWERAIETASPGCQKRFVDATDKYVEAVFQQVVNRVQRTVPCVQEFIELRRDTSAVRLVFALVEYAQGLDLPDEVAEDPVIKELGDCANDILTWANDIYSFNIEQAWGETQNLIVVAMQENNTDLQGGVDFTGDLIKRRIDHYCYLKTRVKSWGPEVDAQVESYIRGLENWVIGVLHWSFESERYFGDKNMEAKNTRRVQLLPQELDLPKVEQVNQVRDFTSLKEISVA